MEIGPAAQIFAFALFSFIAVAGALGMTTTMSMFRSAIFLMASFIGVAGLFLLLLADLLALLQVMMYIGGMLVMALFMVLFSGDPGGKMMTSMMELPLVEKFFSLGLVHGEGYGDHGGEHDQHGEHERHEHEHHEHGGHEDHEHEDHEHGGHEDHEHEHHEHGGHEDHEHEHHEHGGHEGMEPMFNKPIKKPAAVLAAVVGLVLCGLLLVRPAWPVTDDLPDQHSAEIIGDLLMSDYMIAFEGAGLLILLGIFGAVYLARAGRFPDPTARDRIRAAVDEAPAPIDEAPLPSASEKGPAPHVATDGEEASA